MVLVGYEKHGMVAILTVDNPPVNAMSPGVPRGICEGIAKAGGDDGVAAIILMGAGRGFIAGADIRYFSLPWPDGEGELFPTSFVPSRPAPNRSSRRSTAMLWAAASRSPWRVITAWSCLEPVSASRRSSWDFRRVRAAHSGFPALPGS